MASGMGLDEDSGETKGSMWDLDQKLDQPMDEEAGRLRNMYREKTFSSLLLLRLAFQSLGVVYGDLGTSPLYVFYNTFPHGIDDPEDVIGALSLIIYSLTLVPLLKYVFIVCRANDNGQGGTFALYSLLCRHAKIKTIPNQHRTDEELTTYSRSTFHEHSFAAKTKRWLEAYPFRKNSLLILVVIGTCTVIGDGILTPAISVLSASGGIKVDHPKMSNDVVVIVAVIILVGLFSVQHYGTDRVGWLFAPVVLLWFLLVGGIGIFNIWKYDSSVLRAFSPVYIYRYFRRRKKDSWTSLGGIMLSITGTEALFAVTMATVMDCRNWDEDIYRDSIILERESQCRTVFRTAFGPNPDHNSYPDLIVAAISDGSIATYSISSCLGFSSAGNSLVPVAEPIWLVQGHDGPAYDVKFYGNHEDSLLLSCGDDGRIRGWKWKEMLESEESEQGGVSKPVLDLVNPQKKGPWGALSPIPENNCMAVNNQTGSIFAASGDSCAYCWDVEKNKIKMVLKGHSDYLHCIVARNSHNQVITGSEDGTARIWDCRSGKCIQIIDPQKDKKLKELFPYVSCIALDASESWLACGSGRSLSVWNIPAYECVSRITTSAAIQDVSFDDNQVLAVGAEPVLSRFDLNGDIISQILCAPQSLFSISVHPSGVTAVAGYGGIVDIVSQFSSHLCTFQCRGFRRDCQCS